MAWYLISWGVCLSEPEVNVVRIIRDKVFRYNESQVIVFTGQGGRGKSSSCVTLCKQYFPAFNLREHFSMANGIRLLEIFESQLLPAPAIMCDEFQQVAPSYAWHEIGNRLINLFIQTFRTKKAVLAVTMPNLKLLDKNTRYLVNHVFRCRYKDLEKQQVIAKWTEIEFDDFDSSKPYRRTPTVIDDGGIYSVPNVAFNMPDRELWNEYEEINVAWRRKLWEGTREDLELIKEGEHPSVKTMLSAISANKEDFVRFNQRKTMDEVDLDKLMFKFRLSYPAARKVKSLAENELGL
jgi:hypothetical protein